MCVCVCVCARVFLFVCEANICPSRARNGAGVIMTTPMRELAPNPHLYLNPYLTLTLKNSNRNRKLSQPLCETKPDPHPNPNST